MKTYTRILKLLNKVYSWYYSTYKTYQLLRIVHTIGFHFVFMEPQVDRDRTGQIIVAMTHSDI